MNRRSNGIRNTVFNSQGSALIIVLWLLALLGVLTSAFALSAMVQVQLVDGLKNIGGSQSLAQAGAEAWMGHVREDAIDTDVGVVTTEVMSFYTENPIRINEVNATSSPERVEIFNVTQNEIDISGWRITDSVDQQFGDVVPGGTTIPGNGVYVFEQAGVGVLNNSSDSIRLFDNSDVLADTFAYSSVNTGLSWQVHPDGRNGTRPAENKKSDDPGWVADTPTAGSSNARGLWLKVGDQVYEGIQLTQFDENGNEINQFDFATDYDVGSAITTKRHFLPVDTGTGMGFLTVSNNIDSGEITSIYPNGRNGNETSVKVINSEGNFPLLSDTTVYIRVDVPNVSYDGWSYSDTIVNPGSSIGTTNNALNGYALSKNHIVRVDTPMVGGDAVVWNDSMLAQPDPGDSQANFYESNANSLNTGDYQFNSQGDSDGKLYVSEVYDTATSENPEHPLITAVRVEGSTDWWFEIYNPTNKQFTITNVKTHDPSSNLDESPGDIIQPGQFQRYCRSISPISCKDLGSGQFSTTGDGLHVTFDDGTQLFESNFGYCRNAPDCSDVGTFVEGDPFYDPANYGANGDNPSFRRSGGSSPPKNTSNNNDDFVYQEPISQVSYDTGGAATKANQFVELILFGPPQPQLEDKNEFIEVFNTGDTVDLVANNFAYEDQLDVLGNKHPGFPGGGPQYNFQIHPDDPNQADGNLTAGQVGLVLPSTADLDELGVDTGSQDVRLYTLENGGVEQFLSGGLHDRTQEHLVFHRPGTNREILAGQLAWLPNNDVKALTSREKQSPITTENLPQNWGESALKGTPGRVPLGDHHHEVWGWGGEIISGVAMGDTVYLPSGDSSAQNGDIGLFVIEKIEDESGKHDLKTPPSVGAIDGGNATLRTFSFPVSQYVFDRNEEEWITSGDMMAIDDVGKGKWIEARSLYSSYREGDEININTALFEALRGIQVNPAPEFLAQDDALAIIENRSPLTNITAPTNAEEAQQLDRDEAKSYQNTGGVPFTRATQACDVIDPANYSYGFSCSIFANHVRTSSEGVFRAVVRGATIDGNGDVIGSSLFEIIVDRRPIETGSGPMKVIYSRIN